MGAAPGKKKLSRLGRNYAKMGKIFAALRFFFRAQMHAMLLPHTQRVRAHPLPFFVRTPGFFLFRRHFRAKHGQGDAERVWSSDFDAQTRERYEKLAAIAGKKRRIL